MSRFQCSVHLSNKRSRNMADNITKSLKALAVFGNWLRVEYGDSQVRKILRKRNSAIINRNSFNEALYFLAMEKKALLQENPIDVELAYIELTKK